MFRKNKAELIKLKRVHRAEVDIAYFTYEYLSDGLNPENEDNVVRNSDDGTPHDGIEDIAKIHEEFLSFAITSTKKKERAACNRGSSPLKVRNVFERFAVTSGGL